MNRLYAFLVLLGILAFFLSISLTGCSEFLADYSYNPVGTEGVSTGT